MIKFKCISCKLHKNILQIITNILKLTIINYKLLIIIIVKKCVKLYLVFDSQNKEKILSTSKYQLINTVVIILTFSTFL